MPDDKVVSISNREPIKQSPDPDGFVITQLEQMLSMAKSGQLQALFAVGWNSDNSIMSGWQGAHKAAFTLLGGVNQCLNEYVLKEFQRRQ